MKVYMAHPSAELLPLLHGAELKDLVENIRRRGLLRPVELHKGKVIDGRNRMVACRILGISPRFAQADMRGRSPAEYVLDANLERRHLTPSQKAVLALRLLPTLKTEARKRMGEAGRTKGSPHGATKSSTAAAARVGAAPRSVERAQAIAKMRPDLLKSIADGKLTLKQADRTIRLEKQVKQARTYKVPAGEFAVIAADPAWKYDDALGGINRELPYPTMTIDEIRAMKIPAAANCILFLWCTNAHLREAFTVLDAWGFAYKVTLTWGKVGGRELGLGRWLRGQTEHCLVATRGKPVVNLKDQSTLLLASRRANSEKPDEFFSMVESLCPSTSRLELFARKPRIGWTTSGSELVHPVARGEAAAAPAASEQKQPGGPASADVVLPPTPSGASNLSPQHQPATPGERR